MTPISDTQQFAVDIGNSGLRVVKVPNSQNLDLPRPVRISWLLSESPNPLSVGRIRCRPDDPQWTAELQQAFDLTRPSRWWISSVNRPASEVLTTFLRKFQQATWKILDYRDLPLSVEVDQPERVGIDRLLATLAACQEVQAGPLIVIQAGSAVTVDLADSLSLAKHASRGRFLGGAILPGVPMMLRLLGKAADLLPELDAQELVNLPPAPGKNTETAMLLGTSSCLVGGAQHLVARYRQQIGQEIPIVISGGDGPLLVPHLKPPIRVVPDLVLQGIRQAVDAGLSE